MELAEREKQALILIKLGMSMGKAVILAGCSAEEASELLGSRSFTDRAQYQEMLEEKRLLELHQRVIDEQVFKGTSSAIQWKLAHLNPDRWGDKQKVEANLTGDLVVNLVRGKKDDVGG